MGEIPTYATFYEYRGELYRYRSAGDDYVRVWVEGDLSAKRFPDAREFSSVASEPWVMLPLDAIGSVVKQKVYGRWHGEPVAVITQIKVGLNRGLVDISYEGDQPDAAIAAGFRGNQRDGWHARVHPSEVEDIKVETKEYPRSPS